MIELTIAMSKYEKYLKNLRKADLTIKNYKLDLVDFFDYVLQEEGSTIIKKDKFKELSLSYVDNLNTYEVNGKEEEYQTSSLNRKRTSLRMFIKYLKDRDYIAENFSGQIESIKRRGSTTKEVLTPEEILKVEELINEEISTSKTKHSIYIKMRNKLIFFMFIYTGVRVSELLMIKWENIDFLNEKIFIEFGKGDKPRTIPLKQELKVLLYSHKEIIESISTPDKDYTNHFKGYLFYTNIRNKDITLTSKTIERIIKGIMKQLQIEKAISPHSLRHTMASYGIHNKMNLAVLSSILGHASPSITLNIYTHEISEEQRKEEMKKLSFR